MANYETYTKVKEIIDSRRIKARQDADMRSAEVARLCPEIKEIDAELSQTGLLIFRTACNGEDIAPLKKRNLELNSRRRDLIESLGFPRDYTEVKYTCPHCSDSGYIDIKMCSCFKELLTLESIKASGMGRLIEEQSFENFDLAHYSYDPDVYKRMDYNFNTAKAYAEGFGKEYRGKNLLLMGKTGTGKTHISTSVARIVISKGYDVLYESAQNIISAFEADKFRSGYGPYEPAAEKYLTCDLLILDDLGTEFVNQFTISCLYNLFNTRRNRGLSTIVSTNLSTEELTSRYDDRICSRIVGSDFITLFFMGKDHRIFG